MVEGRIAVRELLRSPFTVLSLLVDDHQVIAAADLVAAVRATGAPVYVASRPVVAATVGFALHRGVVAAARRPPPADAGQLLATVARQPGAGAGPPVVAVVEGVNDHENLGALFRNAAAFGVGAVLLDPTSADPLYRRAVRVSVGHALQVPFARLSPWPTAIDELRRAGWTVAALVAHQPVRSRARCDVLSAQALADLVRAGSGPDRATAPRRGVAVLLGAEGPGLSDPALAAADHLVRIAMAPGVDSLNVATAAAIVFHHLAGS